MHQLELFNTIEKHSNQTIINADCLIAMKEMDANSIDFIVTDPPYGLHFMGKNWDGRVPAIEIWAEALRICKPGSMLAAFGGSRTHHHLMLAIEGAGWEIRDVVMWIYGSGFPKSHNKFGLEGYGTALKPAYEPIIIAMKPLDGTFANNAEKWGVAGINIDSSRIPSELPEGRLRHGGGIKEFFKGIDPDCKHELPNGRWPANLILDEESAEQLDEMTGISKSSGHLRKRQIITSKGSKGGGYSNERIFYGHDGYTTGINDSGGASRFFYCAKASSSERNKGLEGMPLKQSSKLGDGIRSNVGNGKPGVSSSEDRKAMNHHPTVKPISLMKYIITLLAPPGSPICLDPFMGSGSTGVACKELGISFIGIEKEKEYVDISKARINNS